MCEGTDERFLLLLQCGLYLLCCLISQRPLYAGGFWIMLSISMTRSETEFSTSCLSWGMISEMQFVLLYV